MHKKYALKWLIKPNQDAFSCLRGYWFVHLLLQIHFATAHFMMIIFPLAVD
ncbi:hypothetical protein DOT_3904 [Desulfosporosinus sp. OT]|nr:hypothetical protein DOT_3904 [Desulfosporosinus sp. OT]